MFDFLKGKLQRWRAKQQREELVYFLDMLKGADIGARAMTVALATDFRNTVMLSLEFLDARSRGLDVLFLVKSYQTAQKMNLYQVASGIAVWIHTNRSEKEISNRYIAKEMWALLASSFDEVEEAADMMALIMGGRELNIEGYDRIPYGFE
jgi:hypothetical protein